MGPSTTSLAAGGLSAGYIANQLGFDLADGAVFHTWESFNAYSFGPGGARNGQGLIAEWLAAGGTAGVGHVEEPTAQLSTVTNEDILFDRLFEGWSFAEAAWAATMQLSFVNTVVGDPLMTFQPAIPGDANLDGMVNLADLATMTSHWRSLDACWGEGDFNGDGAVNVQDLSSLAGNWGTGTGGSAPPPPALWRARGWASRCTSYSRSPATWV